MKIDDFRVEYFKDHETIDVNCVWLQEQLTKLDEAQRDCTHHFNMQKSAEARIIVLNQTIEILEELRKQKNLKLDIAA